MLKLEGNEAAVMLVAKGGLREMGTTYLETLQAAIAVLCGLAQPSYAREGEVLRVVARVHDLLTENNLLRHPAASMVEALTSAYMLTNETNRPSAPAVLLSAMMGNLAVMRIRTEAGVQLIDWESAIEPNFEDQVQRLWTETRPKTKELHV